MKTICLQLALCATPLLLSGCGSKGDQDLYEDKTGADHAHDSHAGHDHGPGEGHDDEDGGHEEHSHEEVDLGTVEVDGMSIVLKQAHGVVQAGVEGSLVVKLPYNDGGASIVRGWIGGTDRTLSQVGKGEYAKDHDDYDIHAVAPDPLPADAKWWFEVSKPDGTKVLGSIDPLR